jgi:glycosyltransferase involved in cell wall biosynthesis
MATAATQVFFEPTGRMHPSYWTFFRHPPEGYQYVMPSGLWSSAMQAVSKFDGLYYNLWRASKALPLNLVKARLDSAFQGPPKQARVTFSMGHVVFRDEPWVVHLEWAHMMTGFDIEQFRKQKDTLNRLLASPNCKRVLTWCEPARLSLVHNLDYDSFGQKVELLPLAAPPRSFTKSFSDDGKVRLLFVGSAHAPRSRATNWITKGWAYDFHIKGGNEVLEVYRRLKSRYPQLELTVRASVPPEVRKRYGEMPGLTIIDHQIPWSQMEQIFSSADVYLFPSHQTPPWGSILDAMSFELPVVTTNAYSNAEIVTDGVTGFIVPESSHVPYYDPDEKYIPSMVTKLRAKYLEGIQQPDPHVLDALEDRLTKLIEDSALRRRMGRAARQEVEQGAHSLSVRNAQLKAVFDAALA